MKAPAREPLCWRTLGRRVSAAALSAAFLGALCVAGCGFLGTSRPVEKSDIAMDTFIRVRAYGPGAAEAAEAALAEFRRLDALLNPYVESSEVAAVNRSAGAGAVRVSPETLEVIERALWYAGRTGGLFDPTVFPLVKAWDFAGAPHVPSRRELDNAVRLVDYRKVRLDRANSTVALVEKGMGLDLGGIAKGYATDRAVAVLRASGVKSAMIDAGGNVYALGVKPSGILGAAPWIVGIQHPRTPGETIATARVSGESVVTSGDYQRYFESGGVRYHHILDPTTGYPARGFQSVTIIGPSSVDCDALSTAVFVMGEEAGFRFLQDSTGFSAVAVRSDGTVATAGVPREGIEVTSSRPGS
ncbi:MAG: FAD:protein FMN transferase [Ignavibacteriales bacterium]